MEEKYLFILNQIKKNDLKLKNIENKYFIFSDKKKKRYKFALENKKKGFLYFYCSLFLFFIPLFILSFSNVFNEGNFIFYILISISLYPPFRFGYYYNKIYVIKEIKNNPKYKQEYKTQLKLFNSDIKKIEDIKEKNESLKKELDKIDFNKLDKNKLSEESIKFLLSDKDIYIPKHLLFFAKKGLEKKDFKKLKQNLNYNKIIS